MKSYEDFVHIVSRAQKKKDKYKQHPKMFENRLTNVKPDTNGAATKKPEILTLLQKKLWNWNRPSKVNA